MSKHIFTDSDLRTAKRMRAAGRSWESLGEHFRCDPETVRRQIDPDYRKVRSDRYRPGSSAFHVLRTLDRIPREEAARRISSVPPDTRSAFQRLMGDPLPGRSALDRSATEARH
jgi:hypothetical protein